MIGNPAGGEELYAAIVARIASEKSSPFFVQVGGFDGVSFDPLRKHILERNLAGIIIEPVPCYFEKIQTLYAGSSQVKAINCAIAERAGEAVIWRFKPEAVERGILPPHFAGISSFLMDDLLADSGVLGRSCPDEETKRILRTLVEPVPVACRTLADVLDSHGVTSVDILQIDTEGYDLNILRLFDFDRFKPTLVQYEHQHLNEPDRAAAEAHLAQYGYRLHTQDFDTIAVLSDAAASGDATRQNILTLAGQLSREGRGGEALHILRYAARFEPNGEDILTTLVELQTAQGLVTEALETLADFRERAGSAAALLTLIQKQSLAAIALFNERLNEGGIEEAEKIASLLVRLAPQSEPFLEAAMSCNQALGRVERSIFFARHLLSIAPTHERARAAVDAAESAAPAAAVVTAQRALNPPGDVHPLLQLRDLHDAGSALLIEPLSAERTALVEKLWAKAGDLQVDVPPGSEWQDWERHYRQLIAAADMGFLQSGFAPASLPADSVLTDSRGASIDWSALAARAAALKAECVFFVAADETYIKLYARHFVRSIQKYAEAPCLMIVHAIGGAARLENIVASLGIDDDRLFFAADDFDAAAVKTLCRDAPPKGTSDRPLAHFQSARFLHVGQTLEKLQLPVFVSDIDLLLQGEVRPLLARFADADLVLNENAESAAFGSRFTANLLLLNPRPNTAVFLAMLRAYLSQALAQPEVTRWIDQCGLLMASHALQRQQPSARIARFDTSRDVNNVMYGAYQDHPYTFLSLYHGFDTETLEGESAAFNRPARDSAA